MTGLMKKRVGLRSVLILVGCAAVAIVLGQLALGERLVLSAIDIDASRAREIIFPAKTLATKHSEIENIALGDGQLLVLSKAKNKTTALILVREWLETFDNELAEQNNGTMMPLGTGVLESRDP